MLNERNTRSMPIQPPAPTSPASKSPLAWKPDNLWWLMLALVALFWMSDLWVTSTQVQLIAYSAFRHHLKAGEMQSISIGAQFIEGKLKKPAADGRTRIVTTRVAPELAHERAQYDVRFEGVVENTLLRDLLSWVVPALLRAGGFERQVLVDRPDRKGRVDVPRVHLKKVTLAVDIDPDAVAALTPGFAGADLANLVNEAALLATRRGAEAVAMSNFTAAVERIVAGLERHQRALGANERRTVAVHEMGHALVAMTLPGADPVHKISIIPRGIGALGYTMQRPSEDRYLAGRSELRNRMAVLMGGRAAEVLVIGEVSTGAADDLVKASDIAHDMVAFLPEAAQAMDQIVRFVAVRTGWEAAPAAREVEDDADVDVH
jgi:ATP-dependent Zn protease